MPDFVPEVSNLLFQNRKEAESQGVTYTQASLDNYSADSQRAQQALLCGLRRLNSLCLKPEKKFPLRFSDLSTFFKYVVYLFKDLAKRIKMPFLTVTSQALIIPIFDLLAVDLELNRLLLMWVAAFKKSLFQLVDFKYFFLHEQRGWREKRKCQLWLSVLLGS